MIAGAARVEGEVDPDALRRAVDPAALRRAALALTARHPALRTVFADSEAGPVQRVEPAPRLDFVVEDFSAPGEAALVARLTAHAYRPFDLATGPPWRLALLRLGGEAGEGFALVLAVHHIVSDFWSLGVMLRDLGDLYAGGGLDTAPRASFRAVALAEAASLAGDAGERLWSWWRETLADVPLVLDLPTDHARPAVPSHRRGERPVALPPAVAAGLARGTRWRGATLYMGLLAAFEVVLHRWSGQERLLVGCPTSGRKSAELAGMVGYLVNPVAIAGDLGGDPLWSEHLARVRAAALGAFAHRDFPLPLLAERLQPERAAGLSPIVQVMAVLQKGRRAEEEGLAALAVGDAGGRLALGPLTLRTLPLTPPAAQFDLSLSLAETAHGLSGRLVFDRDLFHPTTVARLAGQLATLLEALGTETEIWDRRLSELPWLPAAERHQLLHEWQGGGGSFPGSDLLHELVAAQAARIPDAPAVVSAGAWLTYGELVRRARRVAGHLSAAGVGPESIVALSIPRSLEMIVGILGALEAGAAYLALDPALPAERLAFLLADARPRVLLVAAETAGLGAGAVRRLRIEAAQATPPAAGERPATPPQPPDHPAYLIYTSGSTGRPKGVVITHRAIARRMRFAAAVDLPPGSRMIQKTTLSFDVAVFEIFGSLLSGGLLILAPPGAEGDFATILALAARHDVTRLSFPTSLLALVLAQDRLPSLPALVDVLTGGETVPPDMPARYYARMSPIPPMSPMPPMPPIPPPLLNRYGPTETSISVTTWVCRPDAPWTPRLPIGRPIAGTAMYVLGRRSTLAPQGVPGELAIGGAYLARGYLGRPDLTAASFVPDPFSTAPGERLYRSGDIVRLLPDGAIDFLGRVDGQVKVRGFRVELGEIEAALLEHPEIREAVVADREDRATGGRRLVAWVVPIPGAALDVAAVQEYLGRRLPGYMVPPSLAVLPALPLTASGKVDRRALREPEVAGAGMGGEAPRGPLEELLAAMWANLLGVPKLSRDDGFFALGGHSLLATQAIARVRQALGVEVPLRRLFEAPTVGRFAAVVAAALEGESAEAVIPALGTTATSATSGPAPLSFAQERLWFLDRLEPGSTAYNMPGAFDLRGPFDRAGVARLAAALATVVGRHAALRTTFELDAEGEPVQRVAAVGVGVKVPVVDLCGLPVAVRGETAHGLATDEARRPFDLARGPLLRAKVLVISTDEHGTDVHRLLVSMHHIVSDGWSVGVLVRELGEAYAAAVEGRAARLAPLAIQYTDYARWQRRRLAGDFLERLAAWWRALLAGVPDVVSLPTDRPRPAVASLAGDAVPAVVPPALGAALHHLAAAHGATLYMVLFAALAALLARLGGDDRVAVGTPIANRDRLETEGLIGLFVNTLVLPADLGADPAVGDLLRQVRETTLGAYARQEMPFEKLVEVLAPERSLSHSPLFQVMLTLQNVAIGKLALPGLTIAPVSLETGSEKFDLSLTLSSGPDGGVAGTLSYATDLFERTTAERFVTWYRTVLGGLEPGRRVSDLPLLTAAERAALLAPGTGTAPSREIHLYRAILARAASTPDAVAVVADETRLTYGELAACSARLGRRLRAAPGLAGVSQARVGLAVERSPELVVGLLAILAAGAAYVPIDPAYPAERRDFLRRDAGLAVVLDRDRLAEAAAGDTAPAGTLHSDPVRTGGEDTFYVIYTSGSTGRPKGAVVRQGAFAALVHWYVEALGLTAEDRLLVLSSAAFDLTQKNYFAALTTGAELHLAPVLYDPAALVGTIERHAITALNCTPSAFYPLLETGGEAPSPGLASLRSVVLGGEPIALSRLAPWRRTVGRRTAVLNTYGPTECTDVVAACRLEPTAEAVEAIEATAPATPATPATLPLGRPLPGLLLWVAGLGGEPLPQGVPGELWIAGEAVGGGYLGDPARTAAAFRPAPGAGAPGERAYRTGDLARRLPDGAIESLGRLDHQVKVHGFRIELGEIEAALAGQPGVRAAVVAVRPDPAGEARLVAYLVPADGNAPDIGALRGALAARLPRHMVPGAFVVLDAFPLTPSGKVDRRALPAPEAAAADATERSSPRTPAEEMLASLWAELLGLGGAETVGIDDDFFALGGHSLLATRVVSAVRRRLGVELPVRALFDAPTVAGLARRIATAGAPPAPPIDRAPRGTSGGMPLSFAQERLWFLAELDPGSAAYNVAVALRLRGRLDRPALAAALTTIVRRHEVLRTTYHSGPPGPVQAIAPPAAFPLPVVDLAALPAERREGAVARLLAAEANRPFDLGRGPVVRASLLACGPAGAGGAGDTEHVLVVNLHHIATDGWSTGVLVREMGAAYRAWSAGAPPELPPLPIQYADYAVWQRRWLAGEVLAAQLAWWRERLAGLPEVLALPVDRPRPAVASLRGAVLPVALPPDLAAALQGLAARHGATLFMVLLAALAAQLARLTGEDRLAVGSPIANRNRLETEDLIGFFVNTLVLPADVGADPTVEGLLRQVRETTLGAYAHQEVPFEKLVEILAPRRSLAHAPLFQVMLTLQTAPQGELVLPGLTVEVLPLAAANEKLDLSLSLSARPAGGITGALSYATDLFDRTTAARLFSGWTTLLGGLEDGRRVSDLPLLAAAEEAEVLAWSTGDPGEPVADLCLHSLVAAQAAKTPDAVALIAGGERLTYGALRRRVLALAAALRGEGVAPEERVGVCCERAPGLVVALLAVLEAGGAYVPLDPTYPRERLALMLADSGARLLVTQETLAHGLPPLAAVLLGASGAVVSRSAGVAAPVRATAPPVAANLAYLIYTSGSTGRPKGVALEHRSAVALVRWAETRWSPAELAGVLFATSVCFDLSIFELFVPLSSGGAVILAESALALPGLPAASAVTLVNTVPSAMAELVRGGGVPPSVVTVNLAGEALQRPLVEAVYGLGTVRRLWNLYGPSEDTTYSTFALQVAGGERPPGIGRALPGTRAYLLDRRGRPVPPGVPGELLLGGLGLARGYYGRPDLTAERFVPDPWTPGARLYRTGDLVRRNPATGEMEFLGRIDHQVKVRGFRIELGEIEAALAAEAAVRDAVVLAREDSPGDLRLVAYVVPRGEEPAIPALRAALAARLPAYMVPAAFVLLPALPLSPNGKIDRKALPAPEWRAESAHVAPRNAVEEILAGFWRELLPGVVTVGVEDNFFQLGGHSLLATQLVTRVKATFGVELSLRQLFATPNVAALAEQVVAGEAVAGRSETVARVLLKVKGR